ncbi:MAG TPA: DUF1634 domain-containing protein [Candidatus Binataceae bacterium]|nr:DUF1634 domain-containing protein [Candidatus Binataceae bacterium]
MANNNEEDRILREWTPILLRTILITATVVLIAGLFLMATYAPGYYVQRFHAVQAGHIHQHETFAEIITGAIARDPHSVMTIGLFVLTLVPLARVAFCFALFVKERDYTYVFLTAYVLVGLVAGVLLGKIG